MVMSVFLRKDALPFRSAPMLPSIPKVMRVFLRKDVVPSLQPILLSLTYIKPVTLEICLKIELATL